MAVVIFLTSGAQRVVETADSARFDGPFFVVTRKDLFSARIVTLTLRSVDVVGAEVFVDGASIDYISAPVSSGER
jgi:hypothetical protein